MAKSFLPSRAPLPIRTRVTWTYTHFRESSEQQTTTRTTTTTSLLPAANSFMLAAASAANETGAARRRQRRLRQFLLHERLSVAMALAEYNHHTAPRRPTMARARGEESEMNNATARRLLPPGRHAQSTLRWTMTGMCLPPGRHLLLRCGHSWGFFRHTVECIADVVPMVQILDVPVPQSGEQVVEVLQKIDAPLLPEQAINVPRSHRTWLCFAWGTVLSAADGGTVDGSAHDRVLFFSSGADCRADRRQSSSRSWRGRGCMWRCSTEFSCTCGADR